MTEVQWDLAEPRADALIESLRSFGYSPESAIADLIDNSVSAQARHVDVHFEWAGRDSWVRILDDGEGMDEAVLFNAMRPGSTNPLDTRTSEDLGRFGLGLKTASFSQARELTVVSRRAGAASSTRQCRPRCSATRFSRNDRSLVQVRPPCRRRRRGRFFCSEALLGHRGPRGEALERHVPPVHGGPRQVDDQS